MNAYRDYEISFSDVSESLDRLTFHQGMQEDVIVSAQQVHGALRTMFQNAADAADEQTAAAAEILQSQDAQM